ncbi:N-acetylmuramoyl-L-alanine amidase [Ereboglobus sp. PH5-5]|nr:N-acetylmuramoyl-L-alanine amidase [Ereboglobus sp. PH5-5]
MVKGINKTPARIHVLRARAGSPPSIGAVVSRMLRGLLACALFAAAHIAADAQDASRPLSSPTRPGAASSQHSNIPLSKPTAPSASGASGAKASSKPANTGAKKKSSASRTVVSLGGLNHIDLVPFAKTMGYSATWQNDGKQLTLKKGGTRIEITGESREFLLNGTRVFAGSAFRIYRRSLWVSRIDADTLLAPIMDPRRGRSTVIPLKVIAIDAGHGGIDKGKINERLKIYEKDMVLDTAKRLKTLLEKRGYKVVMTRTSDKKVELGDRPEIAAKAGADLFISIHYNSVASRPQSVSGAEVYRFTPRHQVPMRREKSQPSDALWNPGDAHGFWSSVAGIKIQQALLSSLKVSDRGFKHDKLAVLRLAKCPAVLVEAGFLSHNAEARKIATPAYRQQIAEAIAKGVDAYAAAVAAARK